MNPYHDINTLVIYNRLRMKDKKTLPLLNSNILESAAMK